MGQEYNVEEMSSLVGSSRSQPSWNRLARILILLLACLITIVSVNLAVDVILGVNSLQLNERTVKQSLPFVEKTECSRIASCGTTNKTAKHPCYTFYPTRFWRDPVSAKYVPSMFWQRLHRPPTSWYEIEFASWKRDSNVTCDHNDNAPETLVYWHNFKAGGTTSRATLLGNDIPGYTIDSIYFGDWNSPKHMLHETFDRVARLPIHDTVAFTFVRASPVQRFLSALAQIPRMPPLHHQTTPASLPCFAEKNLTASERVECVLDCLEADGRFFNVHLYPQAFLMDTWTDWGLVDAPVTLVHMEDDIDAVLHALVPQKQGLSMGRVSHGDKINVNELSQTLIQRICRVYEVDVFLLQEILGYEDSMCNATMILGRSEGTYLQPTHQKNKWELAAEEEAWRKKKALRQEKLQAQPQVQPQPQQKEQPSKGAPNASSTENTLKGSSNPSLGKHETGIRNQTEDAPTGNRA